MVSLEDRLKAYLLEHIEKYDIIHRHYYLGYCWNDNKLSMDGSHDFEGDVFKAYNWIKDDSDREFFIFCFENKNMVYAVNLNRIPKEVFKKFNIHSKDIQETNIVRDLLNENKFLKECS